MFMNGSNSALEGCSRSNSNCSRVSAIPVAGPTANCNSCGGTDVSQLCIDAKPLSANMQGGRYSEELDSTIAASGSCLLSDSFRQAELNHSDISFMRWIQRSASSGISRGTLGNQCNISHSSVAVLRSRTGNDVHALFISSSGVDRKDEVSCGLESTDPVVNFIAEPQRIRLWGLGVLSGIFRLVLRSFP